MISKRGRYLQERCEKCGWDKIPEALAEAHLRPPQNHSLEWDWDFHTLSLCPNCHAELDYKGSKVLERKGRDEYNKFIAKFLRSSQYSRNDTKALMRKKGYFPKSLGKSDKID